MNKDFYQYLCCPQCKADLNIEIIKEDLYGIKYGTLKCKKCFKKFPIKQYIPRFVPIENYAKSFGFEWNKFSKLRSDKYNNTTIIHDTILNRSGWSENSLKGKFLIECGCGAGNDTEVLLNLGARVISFDYSTSVLSAFENNKNEKNFLIIQADIYNIPLKKEIFDIVYCHRVIQHTPNPERAFYSIAEYVRKNGEMFFHSYDRFFGALVQYKYLLRIITKRINHNITYKFLKTVGPILYPIVGRIKKIKNLDFLKLILLKLIPFDNLDETLKNSTLTKKEKYEYSLLNTFDGLTPKYDNPNSANTIIKWFENYGFKKIKLRLRNPVIITAIRK